MPNAAGPVYRQQVVGQQEPVAVGELSQCVCGVASILTRGEYRVDWTAGVGIALGGAQLFFELVLFAMNASGL